MTDVDFTWGDFPELDLKKRTLFTTKGVKGRSSPVVDVEEV